MSEPAPSVMRLFVALALPEAAAQALLQAQKCLRAQGGGNFTRPENLHITLAFLGQTDRAADAAAALQTLRSPPVEVTVEGVGHFGGLYWAGVRLTPELAALQSEIAAALKGSRFRLDPRPFRPHLTLCRQFRPKSALDPGPAEAALGSVQWTVREALLMHSHREDGKLIYTPIFRKPLG